MAIYWCAIDYYEKQKFESPKGFSIKTLGLFHPNNPFSHMLVMMNSLGYNFELLNDADWGTFDSEYKDVTEEVYNKFLEYYPLEKSGIES